MSESISRAERRALRRVAGVEITAVVEDTHDAIRALTVAHEALLARVASEAGALSKLEHQVLLLESQVAKQHGRITALQEAMLPLARDWRGRIWWMLGR